MKISCLNDNFEMLIRVDSVGYFIKSKFSKQNFSKQRPSARELLKHKFLKQAKKTPHLVDLIERFRAYRRHHGDSDTDTDSERFVCCFVASVFERRKKSLMLLEFISASPKVAGITASYIEL